MAVVTHGNGRTHGYVIKRVDSHPGGSTIVVEGDCGFDYDAASQRTTFRYFPRWRISGPSRVTIPDVASWQAGASQ